MSKSSGQTNQYVLNFLKVGILLLTVGVFSARALYGYTDYGEVQDDGVLATIHAMRAFEIHYTNYMFYTINIQTPGFIETGVYNTRRADTRQVDIVPFYRWRAGPVLDTGRTLDFYIDANSRGFFVVKMPTTLAYTRDGRFQLDSRGRLVTLSGQYPVQGENGDIYLPNDKDVTSARSGMLYHDGNPIDRIKVVVFKSFKEMHSFESLNGSFFVLTKAIQTLDGPQHYAVVQRTLEQNNVLKAITGDILMAKNAYDVSTKTAHLINKALGTAASLASP